MEKCKISKGNRKSQKRNKKKEKNRQHEKTAYRVTTVELDRSTIEGAPGAELSSRVVCLMLGNSAPRVAVGGGRDPAAAGTATGSSWAWGV